MDYIERSDVCIREFVDTDSKEVIGLMRELAVFERYDKHFKVTEADLNQYGLSEKPIFKCFVAETNEHKKLLGIAVFYPIEWTYDLKPTLVLKELYVKPSARGQSVGIKLMQAVCQYAKEIGAVRIKWLVLKDNHRAKKFYKGLGARKDNKWENWQLNHESIANLSSL